MEVETKGIIRDDEFDEDLHIQTANGAILKGRLGKTRDRITMAKMKAQIASYWSSSENFTAKEIAEKVSDEFGLVGQERLKANSIAWHVKTIIKYWKEASVWSVEEKMARIQARYAQLEAIAENALYASMQGKETISYRKQMERARSREREKWVAEEVKYQREEAEKNGGRLSFTEIQDFDDTLIATSEHIEEMSRIESSEAGDPRWLAQLITINDRRADLWNLKAHAEVSSPDREMARLPDEERDSRLAAVINAALSRKDKVPNNLADSSPLGGRALPQAVVFDESDLDGVEF